MAKPSKVENLTFYDWSVARWVTSDAHDELDALGRGIYREMLDYCYVQGSVSADPVVLSRRCACTREELVERWETIERYFYRAEDGKLRNKHADAFREEYVEFLEVQRSNGRMGGRPKKPTANPPVSNRKPTANPPVSNRKPTANPRLTQTETHPKPYTTLNNTTQQETTQDRDAAAAAFDGWFDSYPKAVRRHAAQGAWFQLMESGEICLKTIPDVIAGTERWKNSKEWAKDDGDFIPDASTFLTGNSKHSGRLWKEHPKQVQKQAEPAPLMAIYDPAAEEQAARDEAAYMRRMSRK